MTAEERAESHRRVVDEYRRRMGRADEAYRCGDRSAARLYWEAAKLRNLAKTLEPIGGADVHA